MSSGGIYSEGPRKANDFVAPYLKAFLRFLGMTNLTVFRAEGLKVPGVKELDKFILESEKVFILFIAIRLQNRIVFR